MGLYVYVYTCIYLNRGMHRHMRTHTLKDKYYRLPFDGQQRPNEAVSLCSHTKEGDNFRL